MHTRDSLTRRLVLGFPVLATALLAGSAFAQDPSPAAPPGGRPAGYPVAIHEGTCDTLAAEPIHELDDATTLGSTDEEATTVGAADAVPVVFNVTGTIESSMDDLTDTGTAIAVHAGAEDDSIVACGTIAGIKVEGKLVVALNSAGQGSVVGVAILDEDSAGALGLGEDEVKATIYLFDTAEP